MATGINLADNAANAGRENLSIFSVMSSENNRL